MTDMIRNNMAWRKVSKLPSMPELFTIHRQVVEQFMARMDREHKQTLDPMLVKLDRLMRRDGLTEKAALLRLAVDALPFKEQERLRNEHAKAVRERQLVADMTEQLETKIADLDWDAMGLDKSKSPIDAFAEYLERERN